MPEQTVRFAFSASQVATVRHGTLTLLTGAGAGTLHPLGDGEVTLGRTTDSTVVLDEDGISRRHARFFHTHGHYWVEDLHSTNGTIVDGARIAAPTLLREGAIVLLGHATLRFSLRDEAEIAAQHRAYERTVRDGLTGAYNRHFLDERLAAEVSYARRHGTPLTVMFIDADHFKRVNDTYGHAGGDEVLRRVSRFLLETMRTEDVVARYGGEEFVVVLRGVSAVGVLAVAERVRSGVEVLPIVHDGKRIPVTVSVGVATHSAERPVETMAALMALADAALYSAKESGRNRVHMG
jgi:diguanylate cyclase (GGDEF)-like protein